MRSSTVRFLLFGFPTAFGSLAFGQCENKQLAKFFSASTTYTSDFGHTIAVDGDRAVIGAENQFNPKPVFVFERLPSVGWTQTALLVPSAFEPSSGPAAVAISGSRVLVGLPWLDIGAIQDAGAVFVFEKIGSTWVETAILTAPQPRTGGWFGTSVAIRGERIAVGAIYGEVCGSCVESGIGFVFDIPSGSSHWTVVATLAPTLPKNGMQFGRRVQITADAVVFSAPSEQVSPSAQGAVYVFSDSSGQWFQKARLVPIDPFSTVSDAGTSLAAAGSVIVVGTSYAKAFVFEQAGPFWVQTGKLVSPDVGASTSFGSSGLSTDGTIVVVADRNHSTQAAQSVGACHVFIRDLGGTWIDKLVLIPEDESPSASFGISAAITGSSVLIGSSMTNGKSAGTGAVYEFKTSPNQASAYGTGCSGSGGFVPRISLLNSYDGCLEPGSNVNLFIDNALGNSVGVILIGIAQAILPVSTCTLLLSPLPATITVPLLGFGAGNGSLPLFATIPSQLSTGSIFVQCFVIDSAATPGFSATNGIRLTVQ